MAARHYWTGTRHQLLLGAGMSGGHYRLPTSSRLLHHQEEAAVPAAPSPRFVLGSLPPTPPSLFFPTTGAAWTLFSAVLAVAAALENPRLCYLFITASRLYFFLFGAASVLYLGLSTTETRQSGFASITQDMGIKGGCYTPVAHTLLQVAAPMTYSPADAFGGRLPMPGFGVSFPVSFAYGE